MGNRPYPVLRITLISLEGANEVRPDATAALLRELGHEVAIAGYSGPGPLLWDAAPDVVVVDAGTELELAREVLSRLRSRSDLARARFLLCVAVSRVSAISLEATADDFILSPVCVPELSARLRQLVWREAAGGPPRAQVRFGPIALDPASMEALLDGQPLHLTRYEFQLLKFLVERPARVFPREELLRRVWGYRAGRPRTVDTHVLNLRAKLGRAASLLEAVRGMGYKLRHPEPGGESFGAGATP